MRILLVSGEYPPQQGGVGDYTREMSRAFSTQGHEVSVLTSAERIGASAIGVPASWRVLREVQGWGWRCWRDILSALRRVEPDVVDIQYQAAAYDMRIPAINLLPWRLGRTKDAPPLVVTFHDLKPPYLLPKAGPLRPWAVRELAQRCAAAVVTNAEDWAAAQQWSFVGRDRPSPLHLIPIGSNIPVAPPEDYDRSAWRAAHGYDSTHFVWAYFGFLNATKGGETLVRALSQSPEGHRLLMIGGRVGSSDPTNQAYAARVAGLIDDLGAAERVQWTGYMPAEQVSAALLSVDAVVLPYRDGISFRRGSLHAALAHGCAVVSTRPQVPIAELQDGDNVLLVAPDDPAALCGAAQRLRRDAALRRRIGEGARTLAEQFTWEHIARRTVEEVFGPLVEPSGPGRPAA